MESVPVLQAPQDCQGRILRPGGLFLALVFIAFAPWWANRRTALEPPVFKERGTLLVGTRHANCEYGDERRQKLVNYKEGEAFARVRISGGRSITVLVCQIYIGKEVGRPT